MRDRKGIDSKECKNKSKYLCFVFRNTLGEVLSFFGVSPVNYSDSDSWLSSLCIQHLKILALIDAELV